MTTLVLEGATRNTGKVNTKALRDQEQIPCNLYGGKENINFSAPANSFAKLIYNPEFFKVEISIDDNKYEAIIKEVQFHPVTDRVQHVDFLELVPGTPVKTEIPIKLEGLAEGVRNGGKLLQKVRRLNVKANPEDFVESIKVDVTNLKLGKSIKVREIDPGNIQVLNSGSIPVASVEIPRALRGKGGADDEGEEEEAATEAEGGE